jgi:hypothetical protein
MAYPGGGKNVGGPVGYAGGSASTITHGKIVPLSVFFLQMQGQLDGDGGVVLKGLKDKPKGKDAKKGKKKRAAGDSRLASDKRRSKNSGKTGGEGARAGGGDQADQAMSGSGDAAKAAPGGVGESLAVPAVWRYQLETKKAKGSHGGVFDKSYSCKYCESGATKAYVWADGRAFIPVCESHRGKAKSQIEDRNEDSVAGVVDLPKRESVQSTAPTFEAIVPLGLGAARLASASGTAGTGNVATVPVPIGPPLRRLPRKKKLKKKPEEQQEWSKRLVSMSRHGK